MLDDIPTPMLESRVRIRGLAWQKVCEAVTELHARYVTENPTNTATDTGRQLGYMDGSMVGRYLLVREHWHHDGVRTAKTFRIAYTLTQALLRQGRKAATKDWLRKRG
jgi:hypothetical protein